MFEDPATRAALIIAIVAVALSYGLTAAAIYYARRRGLLDVPVERSSHATAMPSGGGLGIVLTWVVVSVAVPAGVLPGYWMAAVLPAATVLAIVGWLDDHRPLSPRTRFLVQVAVSFFLLVFAWRAGLLNSALPLILGGLTLLWIANLYNFMDGSNGMAGMQGVFSGLMLTFLFFRAGDAGMALVSLLIAASCGGFLPWNLVRARVFMGDVASVPLGFALAALLVYGTGSGAFSPAAAALVLAAFIVDASLTLFRRVLRGERWYTAHRQHLYQQLILRGWSHLGVLALYQSINIVLVYPAIVVVVEYPHLERIVTPGLIAMMAIGWYLAARRLGVTA